MFITFLHHETTHRFLIIFLLFLFDNAFYDRLPRQILFAILNPDSSPTGSFQNLRNSQKKRTPSKTRVYKREFYTPRSFTIQCFLPLSSALTTQILLEFSSSHKSDALTIQFS